MTPEEVEQYVLLASDASIAQDQQQKANALLNHWVSTTDDRVLADALIPVLRTSQKEVVLFFVLTAFFNLRNTNLEQRLRMRQELFTLIVFQDLTGCWRPTYLRTKVGVLLARFIQLDYPTGNWPTAFDELQRFELLQGAPDILLRTLVALMDDFGHNETPVNAKIKDMLRGYATTQNGNVASNFSLEEISTPFIPPDQSVSARLLKTIFSLLAKALDVCNGTVPPEQLQICVLALTALKGFMAWIDLSLVLEQQQVLNLVFTAMAKGSTTDSPMADAAVVAVECLQELIARGMEEEKKLAILVHTNILETIYTQVNLETVDASPIDVVLEVAKFIDRTGLEVISVLQRGYGSTSAPTLNADHTRVRSQLLDLFFRCFAYDDIDVSSAVIPLAGSLIPSQDKLHQGEDPISPSDPVLSQLLTVTFRQMRYPEDFRFDYEDEDEAEEEMYRTELRKLNQKFIRAAPEAFLQFICQTLAQLPLPLSSAPTSNVEAALRLVYHYCEGIRPPPGMKVVMRNETFRNLIVALHTSDITMHPHQEVLTLYYETSVRYFPLLTERPDLLQKVLESISGNRGLQHEHPRVRSRCCYMLLRLVKSVGNSNNKGPNVLRPYVETAVSGILSLLENNSVQLRSEDTLNLFETIGLLLGQTGVEPPEQQRYLTQVMTPHIRSIEKILEHKESVVQDPETYGEILSSSVAAIAFLSKGFKRPSEPVQLVLLETLSFALTVLETLPNVDAVRNKSLVLMQRLIQCLEDKVLPMMPRFLHLVIMYCNTDDILDVSQLCNQLCIKFNEKSVPAIDAALIPFLHKCHLLANSGTGNASSEAPDSLHGSATLTTHQPSMTPPHQRTEQLSIQKLSYMVLNHVAVNKATSVLYTPTNLSSLEGILQSMCEGATRVEDAIMKKTCLVFFKEVLEQWIVAGNGIRTDNSTDAGNPAPATVVQGYIQFLCTFMIPGVLESFAQPHFSVHDANQWRCVLEFAALLDLLREHAYSQVYQPQILVGILTTRLGCPSNLVENFRVATDRKAVETALKTLLEQLPAE